MATDRLRGLKASLVRIGTMRVRVGVMGQNAQRPHPNGNGLTVGDVAALNHFGAPGIPARPFLTIARIRNENAIKEVMSNAMESVRDPQAVGDLVGLYVVGLVQDTISDRVPPPNAPSTIRRKGSDVPLIDTGLLRQSITHEVIIK